MARISRHDPSSVRGFGHVVADHPVQPGEVVAWHAGVHVVLGVPVHAPVQEFRYRVEGVAAHAQAEVGHVVAQAGMHRPAHQPAQPMPDGQVSSQQQGQDRHAQHDRQRDRARQVEQDEARRPHRLAPHRRRVAVDRPHPLAVPVAARTGRVRIAAGCGDHVQAQHRPQPGRLVAAGNVDREQLQQVEEPIRGVLRQHHFAVALRMQRVAVVVAVTHLEVVDVDEAEQAEHAREQLVQPLGPEHRAMSELVDRRALEEGAHHAMRHQRQREQRPQLSREQQPHQRAGRGPQQQVADAVQAAAQVAAPHQFAQQRRLHRRPVPLDPKVAPHLGHRPEAAARGSHRPVARVGSHRTLRLLIHPPRVRWLPRHAAPITSPRAAVPGGAASGSRRTLGGLTAPITPRAASVPVRRWPGCDRSPPPVAPPSSPPGRCSAGWRRYAGSR